MVETLVLVRHAKTQSRTDDIDDAQRALTKAGVRAARASLPRALSLLSAHPDQAISVWSSPAVRAMETARIVARAVGVDVADIRTVPCLYPGDADEFFRQLSDVKGCVIAVGHNPLFEELYRALSGQSLALEKASACAFTFDAAGAAHLEWFVQGPDHTLWKTLVDLESALAAAGGRVSECAWKFLDDPSDPETLHQYRIALRSARSVVAFCEPWMKTKQYKRLQTTLRQLQSQTSRLRELDVMEDSLKALQDPDQEELLENCANAALEERACFTDTMRQPKTQNKVHDVVRELRDVSWRDGVEAVGLPRAQVRAHFKELAASLEYALTYCDFSDAEAAHDVRKQSKQLRYVAKELNKVLGEDSASLGSHAKALQDKLGELCDARVNSGLAASLAGFDNAFAQAESERAAHIAYEMVEHPA